MVQTLDRAPRRTWLAVLCCFVCSFAVSALFMAMTAHVTDGYFCLGDDTAQQQITFMNAMSAALRSGNTVYAHAAELGCGFMDAYGYYGIGSPFFWLFYLLGVTEFAPVMVWYKALTIGLAGAAACLYSARQVKTTFGVWLVGMLYAVSTYQVVNLFFHFSDSLVFFPLLLLGLDWAMEGKGSALFALSVGVAACTNAVFFFSEAVFIILYFAVKLWVGEYKLTLRRFFEMAAATASGLLLAGVVLLPTLVSVAGNPRASDGFSSLRTMLLLKPVQFAEIFRSLLLPAEFMTTRALYIASNPVQADLYIPLFGCVLWGAYVLKERKGMIARLLLVSFVIAMVPVLNSAFMMFNAEYYARWFFMPGFFMAIATAKAYEDRALPLKGGFAFVGATALVFVGNIVWWRVWYKVNSVVDPVKFTYLVVVAMGGLVFCLLLRRLQTLHMGNFLVGLALCVFMLGTGFMNTVLVKEAYRAQGFADSVYFDQSPQWEAEGYYRIDTVNSYINKGFLMDVSSVNSFSSTIAVSMFDFYDLLEVGRTVRSNRTNEVSSVRTLLSCRYIITSPGYDLQWNSEGSRLVQDDGNYAVYEHESYIPMGYTFRYATTQAEFAKLPKALKDEALVAALVFEQPVDGCGLQWVSAEELERLAQTQLADEIAYHQSVCCSRFECTKTGYRATIELPSEALVFFSIPQSNGFSVTVNGESAEYYLVDSAFYAVACRPGASEIEFCFEQPGLKAGMVMSLVGACGIALGCFWQKRTGAKRQKNAA